MLLQASQCQVENLEVSKSIARISNHEVPAWKDKAAAKRKAQFDSIPPQWRLPVLDQLPVNTLEFLRTSGFLDQEELAITETTDAKLLLAQIASRQYSAVRVIQAFSKRAALAQQLIGCCTEMFFEEALERAKQLDDVLAKTGKTVGPLHGLPISFKDLIDVEDQDTTWGWVGLIGKPAMRNSILVEALVAQGAVPYVKTNLSQSIMMSDSYNHIFKQSLNSLNRHLISGGSSGGEGALVGCRGSIVGFGTDTGGSIRIPADLQGLYGLCPTVGRVPFDDSGKRMFIAPPVAGPMATELSTIETIMEGLLSAEPWNADPTVVPIPWRTHLAAKPDRPLRIGFYVDDGHVKPQPPQTWAVQLVIEKLRAAGHGVFEWDPSSHYRMYERWTKAILSDGGRVARYHCQLSGEPLIPGMIVGTSEDLLSTSEMEKLADERVADQKHYLERWRASNLDLLITPVQPFTGFPPRVWVKSHQYVGYTAVWNWLGFTAMAVPVTTVDRENSMGGEEWLNHKPRNRSDQFNWEIYQPDALMNMPVGIQIVSGRFGEERAVAAAKVIQEVLGKSS